MKLKSNDDNRNDNYNFKQIKTLINLVVFNGNLSFSPS